MLSVIIPHYPFNEEIDEILKNCVDSIDFDELIIVVNKKEGFAKAVNRGLRIAHGDHLLVLNNDTVLEKGKLKDLCQDYVTSPTINGRIQKFWGSCFCIPRWVYEKIGGLDERFKIGYYEDEDYIKRLEENNIKMRCMLGVDLSHRGGTTIKPFGHMIIINKKKFDKKWGYDRIPS